MSDNRFLMSPDSEIDIKMACVALENLGLTDYDIQKLIRSVRRENEYTANLGDMLKEYRNHILSKQAPRDAEEGTKGQYKIDLYQELQLALTEKCKLRMENERLRECNELNSRITRELEQELLTSHINQMKTDSEITILKRQLDRNFDDRKDLEEIENEYKAIIFNMSEELANQKKIIKDFKSLHVPSGEYSRREALSEPSIFSSHDYSLNIPCNQDLQNLNQISIQIQQNKWQDSKSISILWFLLKMYMMLVAKMQRFKIIDDPAYTNPEKNELKSLFNDANSLFCDSVDQLTKLTDLKENFR